MPSDHDHTTVLERQEMESRFDLVVEECVRDDCPWWSSRIATEQAGLDRWSI